MYLGCGRSEPECEELVDRFLNNYCESVDSTFVAPSMTIQEMTVPVTIFILHECYSILK